MYEAHKAYFISKAISVEDVRAVICIFVSPSNSKEFLRVQEYNQLNILYHETIRKYSKDRTTSLFRDSYIFRVFFELFLKSGMFQEFASYDETISKESEIMMKVGLLHLEEATH